MTHGECNCGSIAFKTNAEISAVFVCHCSICRRCTGSNGIAVIIVPNDKYRWVRGEDLVTTWEKPGHDWLTSFCQICGSTLPGTIDDTNMFIPAGLINEDIENLRVIHHIHVKSKASWDVISDTGKQHLDSF